MEALQPLEASAVSPRIPSWLTAPNGVGFDSTRARSLEFKQGCFSFSNNQDCGWFLGQISPDQPVPQPIQTVVDKDILAQQGGQQLTNQDYGYRSNPLKASPGGSLSKAKNSETSKLSLQSRSRVTDRTETNIGESDYFLIQQVQRHNSVAKAMQEVDACRAPATFPTVEGGALYGGKHIRSTGVSLTQKYPVPSKSSMDLPNNGYEKYFPLPCTTSTSFPKWSALPAHLVPDCLKSTQLVARPPSPAALANPTLTIKAPTCDFGSQQAHGTTPLSPPSPVVVQELPEAISPVLQHRSIAYVTPPCLSCSQRTPIVSVYLDLHRRNLQPPPRIPGPSVKGGSGRAFTRGSLTMVENSENGGSTVSESVSALLELPNAQLRLVMVLDDTTVVATETRSLQELCDAMPVTAHDHFVTVSMTLPRIPAPGYLQLYMLLDCCGAPDMHGRCLAALTILVVPEPVCTEIVRTYDRMVDNRLSEVPSTASGTTCGVVPRQSRHQAMKHVWHESFSGLSAVVADHISGDCQSQASPADMYQQLSAAGMHRTVDFCRNHATSKGRMGRRASVAADRGSGSRRMNSSHGSSSSLRSHLEGELDTSDNERPSTERGLTVLPQSSSPCLLTPTTSSLVTTPSYMLQCASPDRAVSPLRAQPVALSDWQANACAAAVMVHCPSCKSQFCPLFAAPTLPCTPSGTDAAVPSRLGLSLTALAEAPKAMLKASVPPSVMAFEHSGPIACSPVEVEPQPRPWTLSPSRLGFGTGGPSVGVEPFCNPEYALHVLRLGSATRLSGTADMPPARDSALAEHAIVGTPTGRETASEMAAVGKLQPNRAGFGASSLQTCLFGFSAADAERRYVMEKHSAVMMCDYMHFLAAIVLLVVSLVHSGLQDGLMLPLHTAMKIVPLLPFSLAYKHYVRHREAWILTVEVLLWLLPAVQAMCCFCGMECLHVPMRVLLHLLEGPSGLVLHGVFGPIWQQLRLPMQLVAVASSTGRMLALASLAGPALPLTSWRLAQVLGAKAVLALIVGFMCEWSMRRLHMRTQAAAARQKLAKAE